MTELNDKIVQAIHDPAALVRIAMNTLEASTNGTINVPDASNPFMHNLEFGAVLASNLATHSESLYRKQYRVLATTYDELYHHMSDVDHLGVFSAPSRCNFTFYFKKASIVNSAVQVGTSETRKLVIPRNTIITINEVEFILLYPIEIRVMSHGGIRIVYDNDEVSPLETLTSNAIPWVSGITQNTELLRFEVPLQQLKRRVFTDNINPGTGFKSEYEIVDSFYYARVWAKQSNGNKIELRTTFSEEIYDPKTPTAILRQTESGISVEIPLIYINNGSVREEAEIEIYATKGPIRMDMANFAPTSFSIRFGAALNADESKYSSPVLSMDTVGILSNSMTTGGSEGLTFAELRKRSIQNGTIGEIPITNEQLSNLLQVNGFDIVKSVDNLQDRIFLATRHLPQDSEGRFGSGMACAIQTVAVDLDTIARSSHSADNGTRVTILPTMLYQLVDGVTKVVPDAERPENRAQNDSNLVTLVNSNQYAYSPFHYVLDATGADFNLRPYYLDLPEVKSRSFIAENDTTQLMVSTSKYTIEKVAAGYRLVISSRAGETYKQIDPDLMFAQLSFTPYREIDRTYLNGTFLGVVNDEYVWEFIIGTNHDIDAGHHLVLDNFSMYSAEPRPHPIDLLANFTLVYSVANYSVSGLQYSELDDLLGLHLLPENITALAGESFQISLGENLEALWSNSRTVPGPLQYRRYSSDVPRVYLEDKFLEDTDGHIVFTDTGDGLEYEVLHRKGDQVVHNDEPQWLHRKDDVMRDPITDQPLYEDDARSVMRHLDLLLIDGAYRYVTDSADLRYRDEVPRTLVSYIVEQITPLTSKLLGNTKLYFYPKSTLSDTEVTIGEGKLYNLGTGSSFTITYGLNGNNYRNQELRASIESITGTAVNELIQLPTVTTDRLVELLKQRLGDDVISIDVGYFGPNNDIAAFSYLDTSSRANIKRILTILPSGRLAVEEDIEVQFIRFGA